MIKSLKNIPLLGYVSFAFVLAFILIALLAPWIANAPSNGFFPLIEHHPENFDILESMPLAAPDSKHLMGTDYVGRDVASRLIHGVRNSLFFSIAVVLVCMALGIIIGGLMGFFGGWIDIVLSRFMEIIANFPIFLLQLTLLAFLPQGYGILLFVMCLAGWIPYCRFIRAEFFKLRHQEFVQAAQVIGASKKRIFFRHLLPNSLTPIIINVPFDLTSTIISLGALSFLGFGEPINVASLGELMKQAKDNFTQAWWLAVFPGGVLFLLTLSFQIFGSAVRDWLDPRQVKEN